MQILLKLYRRFQVYLHNTSWIIGERFIAMAVAFSVTVIVARYLGPKNFGILSYALSLASMFAIAGHMGLVGLVVRELVNKPEKRANILGTTFVLKFFGVTLGYVFLVCYALSFESLGSIEFALILLIGGSLFFSPFTTVFDSWFQSRVQAKYKAMAALGSTVLIAVVKLSLVSMGAGLLAFGFANFLQPVLLSVGLLVLYVITADVPFGSWRFQWHRAKDLLKSGAPVFIASFCATIYFKVDAVMLRFFVGPEEVGLYAVASRLSEVWYFLPTAIVASFFPRLIHLRMEDPERFLSRLQKLFDLLFLAAFAIALLFTFISSPIITLFFGVDYASSAAILSIHIWAGVFIFMRAALSKWILIEDVLRFSLITQAAGALFNVGLNLMLIPAYGGLGAAFATLISYAIASYVALLLYARSRVIFYMMTKAIISPLRYVILVLSRR